MAKPTVTSSLPEIPAPQPLPTYKRFRNLTGQVFGRLRVVYFAGVHPVDRNRSLAMWLCECDCGGKRTVRGDRLICGHIKSCGCLWVEAHHQNTRKHGCARDKAWTPEYATWLGMKARCYQPHCSEFKNYGGRGIQVCERWINSFSSFLADMGERPSATHSIDRINMDGHYEPDNCRWATLKEQARNKRSNHLVTFNDETLCVAEWAERYALPSTIVLTRLYRGWSVERALTTPRHGAQRLTRKRAAALASPPPKTRNSS